MSAFEAGLNVTAIGMGVVFVLLTLLVGIIQGMSAFSRLFETPAPSSPNQAAPASGSPSQHELVSVISAAIAAHRNKR